MSPLYLFVYGTLRQGENNHAFLRHSSCIEQECWVYGKLFDTGLGYPVLEINQSKTYKVKGELYLLDPRDLPGVDELEGYVQGREENLYDRIEVDVYKGKEAVEKAILYCNIAFPTPPEKWIESGDWVEFQERSKVCPVLLQETWDKAISQQDRLLFTQMNEQDPPKLGAVRFLPVRTGFNHEGKCFATVLIQNGTGSSLDFSNAHLRYDLETVEAESEAFLAQHFHVPELQVKALSSTPWTFLFHDQGGVRQLVEQGLASQSRWTVSMNDAAEVAQQIRDNELEKE
ncbi:gamma-glutamylcyclotransferase [Bacillus horti]|uniref:Gamma-glutamylcyclotransferase family protein n=1 Tax=Caldalkalibacillus horti TaxID=77523 RepID=A0ABT9W2P2_9BACI|nr:gamma-glutamylcyclotransferase [Bacillus horti]MDQ0167504.1 SLAP domain-containing protein [Bacillus horti]